MSREIPNEIEERRVIRLLAGAAEAIPTLHEVEVEALLRGAAARPCAQRPRGRSFPRRPHLLSAGAVAAAVALAVMLPLREEAPERRSSSPPARVDVHLAAFPARECAVPPALEEWRETGMKWVTLLAGAGARRLWRRRQGRAGRRGRGRRRRGDRPERLRGGDRAGEEELPNQKRDFPAAGSQEFQTLRNQVVQYLVQREQFEQKAADLDVEVTEKQVDARLERIQKQYFGGDKTKFEKQLAEQGMTDEQIRRGSPGPAHLGEDFRAGDGRGEGD